MRRIKLICVVVLMAFTGALASGLGAGPALAGVADMSLPPLLGGGGGGGGGGSGGSGAASVGPSIEASRLTRIVMRLESTSDWATFNLYEVSFAYSRILATSPGASVSVGTAGFTLKGPTPAWAEVLGVLDVPMTAQPNAILRKGWLGIAHGVVRRAIGSENVVVADFSVTKTSGDTATSGGVSRAALVGSGLTVPKLDARPLTLAFYYPWFRDEDFESGSWGETPSGPADNFDPAEVLAMIDQARGAGIDGFVVSWDGTDRTTRGFDVVRAAAALRPGFQIAPLLELASDNLSQNPAAVEQLFRRWNTHAGDASTLTVAGRSVVFLFATTKMDPAQWQTVQSNLAASGINPFVVADTTDSRYQAPGSYIYNPNGREPDALTAEYLTRVRAARLMAQVFPWTPQTLWAATVSPGMDDYPSRLLWPTREARNSGARYDSTWVSALGSRPEWVLVTSWNEWIEATHIQPGTRTGTTALDQTRNWTPKFLP